MYECSRVDEVASRKELCKGASIAGVLEAGAKRYIEALGLWCWWWTDETEKIADGCGRNEDLK